MIWGCQEKPRIFTKYLTAIVIESSPIPDAAPTADRPAIESITQQMGTLMGQTTAHSTYCY